MSVEGFTEVEQDGDVVALQEENAGVESSTKKRGRPPKALKDSDAKAKTAAKSKSTPAKKPKTTPAKIFEEWENLAILELWKTTYYMRLKEELTSNQVIYREFVEELAKLPEPVTGLTNKSLETKLTTLQRWYREKRDKLSKSGVALAENEVPKIAHGYEMRWTKLHEMFDTNPATAPASFGIDSFSLSDTLASEPLSSDSLEDSDPSPMHPSTSPDQAPSESNSLAGKKVDKKKKKSKKDDSANDAVRDLTAALREDTKAHMQVKMIELKLRARELGIPFEELLN
jgi:hypothetical protein